MTSSSATAVQMPVPVPGTFLAGLDEHEAGALVALGMLRRFSRGEVLIFQGEPDDRVMIVLAGRVKVARIEQDGRELMLEIRDPGDMLGELAFIDGGPRVATVSALEPVEALVMPARELRALRGLGWIRTERRSVVVCDRDALRARAA